MGWPRLRAISRGLEYYRPSELVAHSVVTSSRNRGPAATKRSKSAGSGLVEGTMGQTGANTHDNNADEASNVIEERLRLIIDTIPTIVWRKLPDGSADFLNQHFREYTGFSLKDGLGWGWMNALHPDDRLMEEWRAALAAGKPFEKEARLRRADGHYRWFLIRAVPLRDEPGNIVHWYGTSIDIEDLKRTEDRVRLIIDTLPTMVWTVRPDGAVDFVNQRWLDYTGLTLEEEIEDPTRAVHPEDLPRIMKKWLADMAAGEPFEDEVRLRRADGEYRWFLVRTAPLRDEQGNLVKWYGVSIDIEDSKRAEEELRLAYQRLSYHVENTPLAVIEWDKDLFIKRWSTHAEEIFEWKASEALGKNMYDPHFNIIYKEDVQAVDKIVEQLIKGIVNRNLIVNRNYAKDGRVIYCEWYNSALRDKQGNLITILSLVHNVTEKRIAEEQIRQSEAHLAEAQR